MVAQKIETKFEHDKTSYKKIEIPCCSLVILVECIVSNGTRINISIEIISVIVKV